MTTATAPTSITPSPPSVGVDTIADLLRRLAVPARRVWSRPAPGTAGADDLLDATERHNRRCELIDGTLVEKAMGNDESEVGVYLAGLIMSVVVPGKLGHVLGADSLFRCLPRQIRSPDIAFVAKSQVPNGRPTSPIWDLGPALVVEVLSRSNTRREMQLKRRLFFGAGTRMFWMVNPRRRTIRAYSAPETSTPLTAADRLNGGDVLPGFDVAVTDVFSPLDA